MNTALPCYNKNNERSDKEELFEESETFSKGFTA